MTREVRLRELLVGIEGLALLRHLYDGTDEAAEQRLAEVRRLLDEEDFEESEPVSEVGVRSGYRSWSETYDQSGNPIVELEQSVVWPLLDEPEPARALDAACGTGRHAGHLVDIGHEVVGVDLTPGMLSRAAANVPEAEFVEADLRSIPLADEQFDLAVCGLALAHLGDLDAGITELARVLKPGGRLVISVLHPFQAHLGWQAPFREPGGGGRRFVREHTHTHGEYLAAFGSAGLDVRACLEPPLGVEGARAKRRSFRNIPEATLEAYVGLPGILVWDVERAAR